MLHLNPSQVRGFQKAHRKSRDLVTRRPHKAKERHSEYLLSLDCAAALGRVFEAIGRRESLRLVNKYVPYMIHAFAEGVQSLPLDSRQRDAMLPGVYALLGVCSEIEMKHIFANLDEKGRAVFRGLVKEFKRDYKFTGNA